MTIFITGVAGFIGCNLANRLLKQNHSIIGIDNLTTNYDLSLKTNNISWLKKYKKFVFFQEDILHSNNIDLLIEKFQPSIVIHLAALTGVRTSLKQPKKYLQVNVAGTQNIYQSAIKNSVLKFIFASSSSVYGDGPQIPFIENQPLNPKSPYAKSKQQAEQILYRLHQKNHLSTIILRFFSVYGPYGRPDMAPYIFTQAAFSEKSVPLYGDGKTARDYTYIDDVVSAIDRSINSNLKFETINIGNSSPVSINRIIEVINLQTGKKIRTLSQPLNPSESVLTYANTQKAVKLLRWKSKTSFDEGMKKFIDWFRINRL